MIKNVVVFICSVLYFGDVCADSAEINIKESRAKLYELCENGKFAEALPVAKTLVTAVTAESGPDSAKLVVHYHNKAIIERELRDYGSSVVSYEEADRLIRKNWGVYSRRLINLLIDFGALYYETGENELALEKFREAQHITHRDGGIFTIDQLSAMRWITATISRGGKFQAMDTQERYTYRINEENYSKLDMLPAMGRLGTWFKNSGQHREAMEIYEAAIVLIREADPEESYRIIPFLREMSSAAYLSDSGSRDNPLEAVLTEMNSGGGTDADDLIRATLHLADMKLLSRRTKEAEILYRQAWELRYGTPNAEKHAQQEFGHPIQLGYGKISDGVEAYRETLRNFPIVYGTKTYYRKTDSMGSTSFSFGLDKEEPKQRMIGAPVFMCYLQVREFLPGHNDGELDTYFVDLGFSVRKDGGVSMVEVKDSNTPTKLNRYIKNLLRKLKYRPRIENGTPVLSEVVVRQTFNDVDLATEIKSVFPDRVNGAARVCNILASNK